MDQLILEIQSAGLHQYYPVSQGTTRIGRAYDNDIILSDPTVNSHHFDLIVTGESVTIQNRADVNPLSIDGKQAVTLSLDSLDKPFKAGRLNLVLRNRLQPVTATRPLASNNTLRNPFGHWLWAAALLIACLGLGALEFHVSNYQQYSAGKLFKHLFSETLLGIGAFVFALSVLEKLLVNRWEIKQVIVAVCMIYVLGTIIEPVSGFADYYYSSAIPSTITMLSWFLIIIPIAITLYLVHISHLAARRSAFIAILIAAPLAVPAIMQNPTLMYYFQDFSAEANYQERLSAFDLHQQPILPIEGFITQAKALEPGKRSN